MKFRRELQGVHQSSIHLSEKSQEGITEEKRGIISLLKFISLLSDFSSKFYLPKISFASF
jgi:hypothetical protein